MARSRLCRSCGDFHDIEQSWPDECASHFGAQTSASFHIISDSMEPIRSMADGRMYDSKRRYRSALRARGLIEVGNERVEQRPAPKPPVGDTLRPVYRKLGGRKRERKGGV